MGVMANSYNSQKYSDKVMALMGIAISFGRNRYGSGESLIAHTFFFDSKREAREQLYVSTTSTSL